MDTSETFKAQLASEALARFEVYELLLRQWQSAVNLVAPATLPQVWHRHFADSAQLARLVPESAETLVDVGSGGGFPGLVLAIMLAPGALLKGGRERPIRVTLIESDQRKAAFCRQVARALGLGAVEILSIRIENPSTRANVGRVDVVSARALAPLERLFELTGPLFGVETVGLFLKGKDLATEVEAARKCWAFDIEQVPSMTDARASVAVIKRLSPKVEG